VYEQKEAAGCGQCGEADGRCLDFHHRPDEQKWLKISLMVTYGYRKEKLGAEMVKCDVLCANCHRRHHATTHNSIDWTSVGVTDPVTALEEGIEASELPDRHQRRRVWVHEYKQAAGCSRCGLTDGSCLEFHHVNTSEKELSVSQLLVQGYSNSAVLAEIRKCEVICANCHRQLHNDPPGGIEP
jgi:hypothetical protein